MAPEDIQALVDATEAEATERYRRRQKFGVLVADALRRAEALVRLESALRTAR